MTAGLLAAVLLAPPLPDPDPGFVAVSPADEAAAGQLLGLEPDGSVELAGLGGKVTVRDLVSLRRVGVPLPPLPRGPALVTTTGDRVPGRVLGGDAQTLRFRPDSANTREWDVPLSAAAVVWLVRPPADTPPDPARYPWLAGNRNRDVLRFRNGDTVRGVLDGFAGPDVLRIKPDAGDARQVPLAEVAAVGFNPALAAARRVKGSFARLTLADGTRLSVTAPAVVVDTLRGKTLFGQAVRVPLAEVVAVDVFQGRAAHLSDLKPRKAEQAGFLGASWAWAADRTVRGEPLRLLTPDGEQTFEKGLGTHPRTVLVYDLGGKYRRFEALVGLDADSGGRGRAEVRVLVDGKEQPLPELRKLAAGPARPVRVDVRGAKELTLAVDFGPTGDVQADVNWADARLIE